MIVTACLSLLLFAVLLVWWLNISVPSRLFGAVKRKGPYVGFSVYDGKHTAGGLLSIKIWHVGVFYISDPSRYKTIDLFGDDNYSYATCKDVGQNKLEIPEYSGKHSYILDLVNKGAPSIEGANIEVTMDDGVATSSNPDARHDCVMFCYPGGHPTGPQGTFKPDPHVMFALDFSEAEVVLTMDQFLTAARNTGSEILEGGGYSDKTGMDCQLFSMMMLMRLGLGPLTDCLHGNYVDNIDHLGINQTVVEETKLNPQPYTLDVLEKAGHLASHVEPVDVAACRQDPVPCSGDGQCSHGCTCQSRMEPGDGTDSVRRCYPADFEPYDQCAQAGGCVTAGVTGKWAGGRTEADGGTKGVNITWCHPTPWLPGCDNDTSNCGKPLHVSCRNDHGGDVVNVCTESLFKDGWCAYTQWSSLPRVVISKVPGCDKCPAAERFKGFTITPTESTCPTQCRNTKPCQTDKDCSNGVSIKGCVCAKSDASGDGVCADG